MVKNSPTKAGDEGLILGQEDPLEKETHSSILAWEIPWTEERARQATVHRVTKELDTTLWLNNNKCIIHKTHWIIFSNRGVPGPLKVILARTHAIFFLPSTNIKPSYPKLESLHISMTKKTMWQKKYQVQLKVRFQ